MCTDQIDGFPDALHGTRNEPNNASMLHVIQVKCGCLRGCADLVVAGVKLCTYLASWSVALQPPV